MNAVSGLVLAGLALALLAIPAHAEDPNADPWPTVTVPLANHHRIAGRPLEVVLQGPRDVWGMRQVARDVSRRTGIKVYAHPNVRCAARPTVACVEVRVGHWPGRGWFGQVRHPNYWTRVILLNRAHPHHTPKAVAAHELAHALGLGHHRKPGVVGLRPDVTRFSPVEVRALARYEEYYLR